MSPVHPRSHAELVTDREQVVRTIADHRQGIRAFLALFAANRAQVDAAESDSWKSWLARPSTASATGIRAGLQRLAADAIARQLDASAATAIAGQDPLVHLLSQSGREALQRPSGSDEGIAHQVQSRLAKLDPEIQELLRGRYGEQQSNANQATRLGWPSARVDARLHWARNALDWSAPVSAAPAATAPEGLLPTLIEDYLAGTIDADSRALLVKRAMDDVQVATRVERQVRLDLILGEILTPANPADQAAFADRLLAEPEPEQVLRTTGSNQRRSAALPAVRRRAPVPVIGGIMLGCVAVVVLLLVMARPSVPSNPPPPIPVRTMVSDERPTPSPAPVSHPLPTAAAVNVPPTSPTVTTTATSVSELRPEESSPATPVLVPTPVLAPTPVPVATIETATTAAVQLPVPPVVVTTPVVNTPQKPAPVFIKGIHFGSEAVTIAGNRWQSLKQAEDDGLTLRNTRRVMVSMSPAPAVETDTRSLLISGIAAAKNDPLGISLTLPDGDYEVAVWMMENQRANSRLFDLDIAGVMLENIGDLPLGGWATYGPCAVQVRSGKLEIASKARRGIPLLMGLSIHRTAEVAKGYAADFSAGAAKDWQPMGGAWSVADGNYRHTSSDSFDLSVYQTESWSDVVLSASLHPNFDNGYGVAFGVVDAQNYDALYLSHGSAALWRVTNGMRTQPAQSPCASVAQWKWSEVAVTRVGRRVSATINGTVIFTDVDLGEAKAGKIGVLADFNPVDYRKITATVPKR